MESPPYLPPQKKSTPWLWIILGGVLFCCILPVGIVGGLGFWGFNQAKGTMGCLFDFQDAQKGMLQYASEHGGKLPKAETWQDDVREDYRKSMRPKEQSPFGQMPPDGDWGCKDPNGSMTGMAFNSDLSGKKLADIKDQVSTIMLFETSHPSKNLHQPYKPLDFSTSPKIFGKNRGWLEVPVNGNINMIDGSGRRVPVNTGPTPGGGGFNVQVNPNSGDSK
jgi:hypothetical protein